MKTFNNELVVHRGETFSIDKIIQNKDGSPYIISSELKHPYWLLSISTTRYEQANRYVKNYWLDLSNYLRFKSTQAFDLKSLKTEANGTISQYQNGFADITERKPIPDTQGYFIAYGYLGDKLVYLDYNDCVFFVEDENGNRTYKYWSITVPEGSQTELGWLDYKCRIIKAFSQEDTKEWVEQSYTYSITLVAGTTMTEYLTQLCNNNDVGTDIDITVMYNRLLEAGVKFDDKFNLTRPLAAFDTCKPILVPTKMSVLSTINGGI